MRQRAVQALRRVVPVKARLSLHRQFEAATERFTNLMGRSDPLLPPTRLMFVGGSRRDFRRLGDKWVQTFIRVADLSPADDVLDVGCGVGRMAVALAHYLSPSARYEGFDIVPEGIDWCRQAISTRFPRFGFNHADIYNQEYNPDGTLQASEYVFPYADESFDFVFLTSVFTHMLPGDVRHYLGEVWRVLRPGGRSLVTWFVLDTVARARVERGEVDALRDFRCDRGGYRVVAGQTAEAAVSYAEVDLRSLYKVAGLTIQEPILYGSWSGRSSTSGHSQDIVLARK
jgi:SAM-dependent methyltransferase